MIQAYFLYFPLQPRIIHSSEEHWFLVLKYPFIKVLETKIWAQGVYIMLLNYCFKFISNILY